MSVADVFSAIHLLLVERGDRATAEAQERYMKGVVKFHGLKVPVLPALLKEQAPLWKLEDEFDGIVNGWATCDGLCGSVLRPLLPRPELRRRIVSWKDAASPWLQRAAAVTFVNEAKTGLYNAEILEVCRTTVRNPHRFVQLGTGWVLRELSLADRGLVNAFIREHRRGFISEGLRYALEKHPADERAALTAP